jgi:formylglycine-generating enzyme required for sulfatase activity
MRHHLKQKNNRLALAILGIALLLFIPIYFLASLPSKSSTDTSGTFTPRPTQTPTVTPTVPSTSTPLATRTFLPPPSPSPTATLVERVAMDGMPQVFVPAGVVQMGGFDVNSENDEVPSRNITLNAFWVDKLEVTNEMYARCMEAGVCGKFHVVQSEKRQDYFTNPDYKDYPVVNVTWLDTKTYCEWNGRRLPSEAEWERAARGDDMRTFPWGDELPSETFTNFADLIRDTSRVGSYAAGASPYGALDMAGNVWEWTSDFYDADFYLTSGDLFPSGPTETPGKFLRTIRGGSFRDSYLDLRIPNRGNVIGPNRFTLPEDPAYYGTLSNKIGFRCVSDQ